MLRPTVDIIKRRYCDDTTVTVTNLPVRKYFTTEVERIEVVVECKVHHHRHRWIERTFKNRRTSRRVIKIELFP